MIRPRISIYGQILFWFFLNLAGVAAVLFFVLKGQFGIDPSSFLFGRSEQRFATVATALGADLRESPRDEWEGIVTGYAERHGMSFGLYRASDRALMAGSGEEFPSELLEPLRRALPPRERGSQRRGQGGGPFGPGPPPDDGGREGPPPGEEGRDGPRRGGEGRGGPLLRELGLLEGGDPVSRVARVFHLGKAEEVSRYIAAAVVSLGNREFRHPPDGILVVRADSLGGSSVFFDWRPWGWALAAMLIVSALVWLPFVMRLTSRLQRLTAAAETMAEGNFAVEVASNRGDELGRLSRAVQRMAGQLGDYVTGQKRFLGDIAHELCSPLARLRMALGVLESKIPEADHDKLETLNEEAAELGLLVNELLDFSRASLKPETLPMHEVPVAAFLEEVAGREGLGAIFKIDADPGLAVTTNRDLLRRALANVVRNAARYAGDHAPVDLQASSDGNDLVLRVLDRGPGIPEEWIEKIFEPFSRPEKARTRESGGSGLGLAIAKTCMDGLGGSIQARNRPEGGLVIELTIPQNP